MTRLQVLVVDDEELARLRLRSLLADCTLPAAEVVAEAGSGAEALHKLSSTAVDLVLLDIHMPGLDGLALAERLRALERPPKVVFVTAHADHALRAFDLDAVDYLTKPVRRARLQEALARVAQRLGDAMLRIHRTALVARTAVTKLERRAVSEGEGEGEGWAVQVGATQEWLAVSRRQLTQVRELLAEDGV